MDEVIIEIPKGMEEAYKELLQSAMACVNKQLKLNRDLACDIQFGDTYAEIH